MKLTPEMIPKTSFFSNLRSLLSKNEWDAVRRSCYKAASYKCEICGGQGNKHPVECHEIWNYNEETRIQKLINLIALCPACHEVIHIGLAGVRGRTEQAIKHLKTVNKLSDIEAQDMIHRAWKLWEQRNTIEWKLDISLIKKQNQHHLDSLPSITIENTKIST